MKIKTTAKSALALILLLCLIAAAFTGCGAKPQPERITSLEQLAKPGTKIGVMFNVLEYETLKQDYPDAEIVPYNDNPLGYKDVVNGRIDAYVYARREMELAIENGTSGVRLLAENYSSNPVAVGISPKAQIPDLREKLNEFIAELKADGTLDDMFMRWVVEVNDEMPDIPAAKDPQYHLRVGTTGTVMPYSYYVGAELNGYDIELAYRFASWIGADVEFLVYDFSGIISAASSGDIDCIMSNLYRTAEDEKVISFSDDLFEVEMTAMVKDDGTPGAAHEVTRQDYNGKRIGVLVGPLMEDAAAEFFPDSEYYYYNSYPDCVTALLAGKIDGFLGDEPGMIAIHAETPEIDYIHDRMTENNYSFAFRKDDPESAALCEELNAFLATCRADGTMDELAERWLGTDESRKVVDTSDLTGENGVVRVATTSTDMPWSYIRDGKNVGYDIDLVVRFCRERGYELELGDMDFAARIPAVQTGRYDFSTDMNVTPEREEQVLFSAPTAYGGIVLAVRAEDLAQAAVTPEYRTFEDLSGKTVSMLTGAPFEELVKSKAPDVKNFTSFTSTPDMLLALKSGKTDAMLTNNAIGELAVNRDHEIALFPQSLQDGVFGFAFAKGSPERDAWQAALDAVPEETKQAVWEKWTGSDEGAKVMPEQNWPGTNGTVRAAVCDTLEPMSYVGEGGELIGFDLEMILLIARELDVHVEFEGMDFSAILACVQSGKALVGAGSIIVTEERRQAVDFAEYWPASFVLVVRAEKSGAAEKDGGFFSSVADSFEKTFIREKRWQMFLKGVGTTLLITVLSIILGTLLGFTVFMLCRNGNPVANTVTRFCVWLVQGMPVVVLLMILCYVIFGKVAISGVVVSVVGFTLIFGAAVFAMMRAGVGAVDPGQCEAAYSLGYTDRKAFFRIVLPQALPHFLPAYRGEITALIKATAVVGYVAVQDLTKVGDIVRSRTYEAFFPLIAVAVIYFILAAVLTFIVNRLAIRIDPRRRSKNAILKGVKRK